MGKTVDNMRYTIETYNREHLLAKALRDEMAIKWSESLQMANSKYVDKSRFDVYWEEEIDKLADFQLQLMTQHQERWERNLYSTW